MSGPHMFGVTRRQLTLKTVRQLRAIGERHGADFVWAGSIPGSDTRGWFTAPNLGHPFDDATANAVMAEVESEKIEY